MYLFFVIAPLLFSSPGTGRAGAGEDDQYLAKLLATAREQRLSEDRYWEVLVHYKKSGSAMTSLIDDPKFFLAPDGKKNPQAELEATVRSFFRAAPAGAEHPRCRFVARYAWLKERLHIDEARLAPAACTRFNEALAIINPKSAVMVFPAAHVNSPTTMFGHTLLRIDSAYQSELLSHAVSYAAVVTDTNGIVYGFKGVFGFYKGYFSILPYYEKVKEYNNMEHRDIWEYPLNLSEEEVRRMVFHIWELENVYSDYYFFDENCSYNLLFLLEAARPSLHLTGRWGAGLRFWVIPSDTIRTIRERGLIAKAKYRPSQAERIRTIAARMDDAAQASTQDVVDGKSSPERVLASALPLTEKMNVLDLSAELLQYRVSRREMEKNDYLKSYLGVLKVRSSLGRPDNDLYAMPAPPEPEQGHQSGKAGLGLGYKRHSWYAEANWRAAYHDLLDPDAGFMEGSEIRFFDVHGRYYFKDKAFRLESLYFIDIFSLAPRDRFFKPLSWKVNFGLDRELLKDGKEHLILRVNPGRGVASKSSTIGIFYLLAEADVNLSNAFDEKYSIGLGGTAGILKKMGDIWKIDLSVQSLFYKAGEDRRSIKATLGQNFKITTNNSITLSLSREKTSGYYQSDVLLGWNFYY